MTESIFVKLKINKMENNNFPQKPTIKKDFTLKEQFLSDLPDGQFEWKFITGLTAVVGKSERTLKNWLDEFIINGFVKSISHGMYEKIKQAA